MTSAIDVPNGLETDRALAKPKNAHIFKTGHPILHTVSRPVLTSHTRVPEWIEFMRQVMKRHNGLGLSSIQLGVPLRIMTINVAAAKFPFFALVNPEIEWRSQDTHVGREGCLSSPGVFKQVRRHKQIDVRFMSRDGTAHVLLAVGGLAAVIIQHEIDHMDGKTLDQMGIT